jgi:DNA-binding NarL/FixJ family response regulator
VKSILIADQRQKVRFGLQVLLREQLGYPVIGFAADASSLLVNLKSLKPDILMLDWNLPGMPSVDLIRIIRENYPQVRILIMSANPDTKSDALSSGVDFYINKGEAPATLLKTLHDCSNSIHV